MNWDDAIGKDAPERTQTVEIAVVERHYTPEELGGIWSLSADTIRRLFDREPGVLVIERSNLSGRRRYRTLRIPESVAARVHRRMTYPLRMPNRSA
jgi:hypothetical protein